MSCIDRAELKPIEAFLRKRDSEADVDLLMLSARAKQLAGQPADAVHALNQVSQFFRQSVWHILHADIPACSS